jgi:hypothetical protein
MFHDGFRWVSARVHKALPQAIGLGQLWLAALDQPSQALVFRRWYRRDAERRLAGAGEPWPRSCGRSSGVVRGIDPARCGQGLPPMAWIAALRIAAGRGVGPVFGRPLSGTREPIAARVHGRIWCWFRRCRTGDTCGARIQIQNLVHAAQPSSMRSAFGCCGSLRWTLRKAREVGTRCASRASSRSPMSSRSFCTIWICPPSRPRPRAPRQHRLTCPRRMSPCKTLRCCIEETRLAT